VFSLFLGILAFGDIGHSGVPPHTGSFGVDPGYPPTPPTKEMGGTRSFRGISGSFWDTQITLFPKTRKTRNMRFGVIWKGVTARIRVLRQNGCFSVFGISAIWGHLGCVSDFDRFGVFSVIRFGVFWGQIWRSQDLGVDLRISGSISGSQMSDLGISGVISGSGGRSGVRWGHLGSSQGYPQDGTPRPRGPQMGHPQGGSNGGHLGVPRVVRWGSFGVIWAIPLVGAKKGVVFGPLF